MAIIKDMVGMVFGRLTVVNMESRNYRGRAIWNCICTCGNTAEVLGDYLRSGDTKSCGCFKSDNAKSLYTKHGKEPKSEYRIWYHLRSRCNNVSDAAYKNYGGRGIKVCDRWQGDNGFVYFLADMGKKPSPKHSIDRVNNGGNYEPGNCRWATMKEQQNNRTNNRIIEYNGFKGTVSQAADNFNIKYNILRLRIGRGWEIERAINYVNNGR